MSDLSIQGEVVVNSEKAESAFDRVGDKASQMANEVTTSAGKAGQAVDGMGDSAEKSAEKFTRADSLMRAAIMKSTRELELLGKTASQRFEAQIDFKGLEKAKFQEAISGLQAMESALSVAKAREAEFAAQNAFSLKAAQAKELVKASEYARWWAQELEKVEAAEKRLAGQNSFIASLKSQADAIGKTKADLLEMQAAQMGVATQAAPFIAKMREAEAGVGKMGISAAQTAAALRGVPAQFTDIVTSLQGGQAPLTVFLQQGGQLKDMFGGAGAAARALGGYVVGLINPFTLAAAGAAALAVAYNQGSKEADGYRQAIVLTGNAAGLTIGQMQQMAQQIGVVTGSQREAAGALATFATSGKVGADNLRQFTQAAIEFARVTGQSVDDVAKNFADLANDPLKATLKLNDSMNFLTESIFRQIQSLQEQGRETEAANVAQRAYADTLNERKDEIIRNLGSIEKAWAAIKKEAGFAMDAFLDIGRASALETRLQKAQNALQSYQNTLPGRRTTAQVAAVQEFGGVEGLQREIAGLQDLIENQRKSAQMERDRAAAVKASGELAQGALKYETDLEKQRREVLRATQQFETALTNQNLTTEQRNKLEADYIKLVSGVTAVKEKSGRSSTAAENKELRDQMRVFADLAGVSSTYYAELANYQKQRANGVITEQQYVQAVETLIQKQPFAVAQEKAHAEAIKESAKAVAESSKALGAWYEVREKESQSLQNQINARREEVSMMGMTTEAVVAYTQAKYEQQAAEKEAYAAALESASFYAWEYAEAYNIAAEAARNQAKQLRELGGLEVEKVSKGAAKKAADEWQRTADQINQSLTDALLRGFESGKDFARNLRDTVVNMFKTMVLRPVISAIISPISGALLGGMGLSTAAQAGQGVNGVSTAISGASLLGRLGAFGGGMSAGFGGLMGSLGLSATGSTLGGAMSAGSIALGSGNILGGLGTFAGALGPIALGIGLLSSAFSRKLKDQGIQGTLGGDAGFEGQQYRFYEGGLFRSDKTTYSAVDPELARMLAGGFSALQDQVTDFAEALSLPTDRIKGFTTDIKVSFKGLDDAGIQKALQDALATGSNELAQQVLGTLTTTTREVTETLAGGMGDWGDGTMQTVTRTIEETTYAASEYARGGEKAIDTLTRLATSLSTVNTMWENLGHTVYDASLQGADAASKLADAFGGLEAFAQSMGAYFQNFYSDAEQKTAAARQVSRALGEVGIDLDVASIERMTRPAIRAFVESIGAQFGFESEQYVTAIGQANVLAGFTDALPSVLQTTQAIDTAAQDAARAAEEARRAWQQITDGLLADQATLQIELLRAQGREEEALARERALAIEGMDAYQTALYDSNRALRSQIDTLRELGELLPSVIDQYLSPEQRTANAYQSIAAALVGAGLSGAGVGDLAQALVGASKGEIAEAATAIYQMTGVTDEMRVALLRAAGSLATLKDEAASVADAGLDSGYAALERAVQARRSVVQETVNDVRAVFDTVRSAARDLFGEVDSVVQFDAKAGRAYITQALGAAQSTGYLPDGEQLSEAIRTARAGLQGQVFASQAEADYQKLVLANELKALQDISGDQLTDAEQQLKALDGILDSARAQIDALRGIDNSVMSVEAALQQFGNALLAATGKSPAAAQAAAGGAASGAAGMPDWATFGVGDWMVNNGGSLVFDNSTGMLYGQGDVTSHRSQLRDAAAALLEAGQNQQLYDAVRGSGFTLDQADAILGLQPGDAEAWARAMGLPVFHEGTPYVPRTGFAVLQQGEAVIPRTFNPFTGGGSSGNAELLAELRALREQNARLEAALDRVGNNTGSTATALNSVVRNNALVVDTAPEF